MIVSFLFAMTWLLLVVTSVLLAMACVAVMRCVLRPRWAGKFAVHQWAVTWASPGWSAVEPLWSMEIISIAMSPRWPAAGHAGTAVSHWPPAGPALAAHSL